MKKLALYAAVCTALFLGSCSSDSSVDTEKPVIVLVEPEMHQAYLPGSEIHVEGVITDNDGIASYKIEIHGADDGHSHARAVPNYFQYEESFTLPTNPKVYELNHKIQIPLTQNELNLTDGHYHLGIFVLDKSGNQEQLFVEIYIGADANEHEHE